MNKIAQPGGMTINESIGGWQTFSNWNNVCKTLTAFAMQKYYDENSESVGLGQALLSDVTGGIYFDTAAVVGAGNSIASAKGYNLYFKEYLDSTGLFTPAERILINTLLPTLRDWYIQAGASGMTAIDTLNRNAFLLGGAGSDGLLGGTGADLLIGNGGADLLQGKGGNDALLGGAGLDTYVWNTGDGNDILIDADRRGRILANGTAVKLLIKHDATTWTTPDNKVILTQAEGRWKLSMDGGSLDLGTSFDDSDYGIYRTEMTSGGTILRGDLKPILDSNDNLQYDSNSNVIVGSTEAPGREDHLYGSDNADTILGLEGQDIINGKGGHDLVEGGSGSDILIGDAGSDTIYGLSGPAGSTPLATMLASGDTDANQDARGDWVDGQSGDDILVGTAAKDLLTGGTDNDLLIGGAGNDLLLGDVALASGELDWNVARTVEHDAETQTDLYRWTLTRGATTQSDSVGGADVLYGGRGEDWLLGGAGDDLLDGGADADVLFGEAGNDVILGGAGNDVINGDSASLAVELQGNDWIDGGDGDDRIWGMGGDDILIGGKGTDTLRGGTGRDTYIFNKGDGIDEIYDDDTGPEKSILVFGEGFDKNTIKLRKGSLLLDLGEGDAIHIETFDADHPLDTQSFASFQFADGSSLTWNELLARGFDLDGTEGDDTLVGTEGDDRINGLGRDDFRWRLRIAQESRRWRHGDRHLLMRNSGVERRAA